MLFCKCPDKGATTTKPVQERKYGKSLRINRSLPYVFIRIFHSGNTQF
jgi:hypothetical protein